MARSVLTSVENNFVNGLISEATGLNFPENAVVDTDNCVYDQTGRVSRRLGIDIEEGYTIQVTADANYVYNEYLWENVGDEGQVTLHLQQIGPFLSFYRVSTDALSQGYVSTILLTNLTTASLDAVSSRICQFTSGFGHLFIAHPVIDPTYIKFNPSDNSMVIGAITVKTRDFEGSGEVFTQRTGTLSSAHLYDLQNQGWSSDRILNFNVLVGVYPSDSDVWWLYKNAAEEFTPGTLAYTVDRGNSPAPRGSYILDEFYQDRGAAAVPPQALAPRTSGGYRPAAIEFFAGRIFYAGIGHNDFGHKVYFTQIIQEVNQFGRCYQVNDPTSEIAADLLPTDGGVISIPDAGTIHKLWSIDGSLLIFASNGIWQIGGSTGIGFAANDYTVKKISHIQTLSPNSFVDMLGMPVWWASDNIYAMSVGTTGAIQAQSLSDKKISSFFEEIPAEARKYAKGAFNVEDRTIQWVYRMTTPNTTRLRYTYTHILNFDTQTGAFYPWSISSGNSGVELRGITCVQGNRGVTVQEALTDNLGNAVTDQFGLPVTTDVNDTQAVRSLFKYVVTYFNATYVTFAEARDANLVDWASVSATDYESFLESGYRLRGEAQRKFQSNYLTFYTENETPSVFYVNGLWDFATSASTGRWSSTQKVTMNGGSYKYNKKRVKIRGHGVALQYRIASETGQPFDLIGWSAFDTVNGSP